MDLDGRPVEAAGFRLPPESQPIKGGSRVHVPIGRPRCRARFFTLPLPVRMLSRGLGGGRGGLGGVGEAVQVVDVSPHLEQRHRVPVTGR